MKARPQDPAWVRWGLTFLAAAIMTVLIVIPVIQVFWGALIAPGLEAYGRTPTTMQGLLEVLKLGPQVYWENLVEDRDTRHAIWMTLTVAPTAVALNMVFGVAAAWAIARFRFPGRSTLITLIDLPFSVSPVVAGLMIVLIFGLQGWFGEWLREHHIRIIFSWPGLVIATTFVTMPFIARELIPVMEALGDEEELAALTLGASGWQMFWWVTIPNIKWGLLYGIILCNARAMGEFGAVYVVSGRITGQTDTIPLRVEKLFQEYNTPGSFALASVLTLLAILTLIAKAAIEAKMPGAHHGEPGAAADVNTQTAQPAEVQA